MEFTTLAPPSAPAWASDPVQLWNRVDVAAEKRGRRLFPKSLGDAELAGLLDTLKSSGYIKVNGTKVDYNV